MEAMILYAFRTTNELGLSIIVFRESEFVPPGSGMERVASYDLKYYFPSLGE